MREGRLASEMRSTKLVVSLACLVSAGLGIGIALAATSIWLGQPAEFRSQLTPGLLKFWAGSAAATVAALLVPIWIVRHRINDSVLQITNALLERRTSGRALPAINSPNRDREYQRLVSELNALMVAFKVCQNRLDQYAAKVAHELRGPITLLQLQLDYAAKELEPEFVDAMNLQIRRLTEYVDTALFIAKVAADKIRPNKTRRRIAEVIQEIVNPYELRAAGEKRRLSVELSTEQEAELDERIFGLILHNLLSNAFAHGVGETRLRLRRGVDTATLFVGNRVRTKLNAEAGTGIGLQTIATLAAAHGLRFRSRRVFNNYAAVLRITTAVARQRHGSETVEQAGSLG
jgi:signal transduction histidine kinase